MNSDREWNRLYAGVVLSGLVFYLLLVLHIYLNFESAVPRFVPDDALYYLKIAQSISGGHGSAFSESEPTNGYHPLWMGIVVALDWLFHPSARGLVGLVLLAGAVITIIAALALRFFLAESGFPHPIQCLGVALFLFMPWTSHLSLSCLETPVFFLCLFLFYDSFERMRRTGERSARSIFLLGTTSGLLMLARTDSVLVTAPLYLWLLAKDLSPRNVARLFLAGLLASAILSPWLLWNIARFGSIMQCSGEAMGYIGHLGTGSMNSITYYITCTGRIFTALYRFFCYIFFPHAGFEKEYFSKPLLYFLLAVLAVYSVTFVCFIATRKRLIVPAGLLLPTLLIVVVFFYVRTYVQVWHLAIVVLLIVVSVLNMLKTVNIRPAACVAAALGLILLTMWTRQYGYFYPQSGVFSQLDRLNNEPEVLKIGSTDCGYAGYFTKHHVVNLDGVVNNRALEFIKKGRLQEYINRQGLSRVMADAKRMEYYNRNMPRR